MRSHDRLTLVTRWFAGFIGTVLLTLFGFALAWLLFLIALQRFRGFRDRVRQFNKQTFNPVILGLAGHPASPYAVVHHVGRRSGRVYATPVIGRPMPDGFIVPLPYGRDTDWCRNVLATGRCTISWHGHDYTVSEPEIMDLAAALPPAPQPGWRARIGGNVLSQSPLRTVQCLRVKRLSAEPEGVIAGA